MPLKFKVSVTYTWEETVRPEEYEAEDITNVKEYYVYNGAYADRIYKLDSSAENCLPDGYKCSVDVKWEE